MTIRYLSSNHSLSQRFIIMNTWPLEFYSARLTISLFYLLPKSLLSKFHLQILFYHDRVVCCLPTGLYTSFHQPRCKYQYRVFYHVDTILNNSFHPSIYSDLFHASDCSTTIRYTVFHQPKHKFQNHWFCYLSISPCNNSHPSMCTFPLHFSYLSNNFLHIYYHRSMSMFLFHVGNHQTITPRILHHCSACTLPYPKLCPPSTLLRKHLHQREWIFLNINIHTNTICFTILPLTFILCSIWPYLNSISPTYIPHPFPLVYHSIFKFNRLPLFNLIESVWCSHSFTFPTKIRLILIRYTWTTEWGISY